MTLSYWTCPECNRLASATIKMCRGCGARKPDIILSDDGHIEVRRKPKKPSLPKQPRITAKPTTKHATSAQGREERGETFHESFMDRARRD